MKKKQKIILHIEEGASLKHLTPIIERTLNEVHTEIGENFWWQGSDGKPINIQTSKKKQGWTLWVSNREEK